MLEGCFLVTKGCSAWLPKYEVLAVIHMMAWQVSYSRGKQGLLGQKMEPICLFAWQSLRVKGQIQEH